MSMKSTPTPLLKSNANKKQTIGIETVTVKELDDIISIYKSSNTSYEEMDFEATEKEMHECHDTVKSNSDSSNADLSQKAFKRIMNEKMAKQKGRKFIYDDNENVHRLNQGLLPRSQESNASNKDSPVNKILSKERMPLGIEQSNIENIEWLKLQIHELQKEFHQERIMKIDIVEQLKYKTKWLENNAESKIEEIKKLEKTHALSKIKECADKKK